MVVVAAWRSAYDCCAETMLIGKDHANHSVICWWISEGIVQALDSFALSVYLTRNARL